MPFDEEVVSPELVLVAPELASVTWSREAAQASPETPAPPPRARRAHVPDVARAAAFLALAGAGLAVGLSLSVQSRTAAASAPPPAPATTASRPRIALPPGKPRDVSSLAVGVTRTSVSLTWQAAPGSPVVEIVRSPGLTGARPSSIYEGRRRSFVDSTVAPGTQYRYVVYAVTRGPRRSPGVPATVRP
jgi:hypothetical protein